MGGEGSGIKAMIILTDEILIKYNEYLIQNEKSLKTTQKYLRDANRFKKFAGGCHITKNLTVAYKDYLIKNHYASRTVNAMIASLNSLLGFLEQSDCKVKNIRIQRQIYSSDKRQITREEYLRLIQAAMDKNKIKLKMILQTICSTGIRISELQYFTVEAVKQDSVSVSCKNKIRVILIPGKLKRLLLEYAKSQKITSGAIFRGTNGSPINRGSVWAQMKRLCRDADVNPVKVFPHNLRKLFARTFYNTEKDIAKLADILGHSSLETTRIYIMTTIEEHKRKLERLGLLV